MGGCTHEQPIRFDVYCWLLSSRVVISYKAHSHYKNRTGFGLDFKKNVCFQKSKFFCVFYWSGFLKKEIRTKIPEPDFYNFECAFIRQIFYQVLRILPNSKNNLIFLLSTLILIQFAYSIVLKGNLALDIQNKRFRDKTQVITNFLKFLMASNEQENRNTRRSSRTKYNLNGQSTQWYTSGISSI